MAETITAFEAYWNEFVHAHRAPTARRFLFAAVSAGIGSAALGVLTRRPLLVLLSPIIAFVPPWLAQRGQQGPSDETHPLYFMLSSLKLWHTILTRGVDAEWEVAPGSDDMPSRDGERQRASGSVRDADRGEEDASFPRPNMVTDHTLH